MIAITSDIHGNLEALDAVLADAESFGVQAIYCLGDLVGYGPDPIPCVQRAIAWPVVLRGDFERATVDDNFSRWSTSAPAQTGMIRFRTQLAAHPDREAIQRFLGSLPTFYATQPALYVHGSPSDHTYEYLFPEDIYNQRKMDANTSLFGPLCFCGHTHVPGIFHRDGPGWNFKTPAEIGNSYALSKEKLIVNVGSVGQPRDRDPRACYVLYTPERIQFRRVDYDIDRTVQKIRDQGDDGFGAQRLHEGY